jgi:hypothetical protein
MKFKITLLLLLFYFRWDLKSQEIAEDFVYQSGCTYFKDFFHSSIIKEVDTLPSAIEELATDFVKNRFAPIYSKMEFVNVQIASLDSLQHMDVNYLKESNKTLRPIPFYSILYYYRDSILGIRQFCINLKMDYFGQVIDCNFPILSPERNIISLKTAKKSSDNLIYKFYPNFKIKEYKCNLVYDKVESNLVWEFCYISIDGKSGQCFLIDAFKNRYI